jgi:hypothetical protein
MFKEGIEAWGGQSPVPKDLKTPGAGSGGSVDAMKSLGIDSGFMNFDEKQITEIVQVMPAMLREVINDEDERIPWEEKEKQAKAEKGWRKEDPLHETVRYGISSFQQSCVGPSYNPFGLLRYIVHAMVFLVLCDALLP